MRNPLCLILALTSLASSTAAEPPADAPYLDTRLPVERRVADLISRLTLEEKAMLLNHKGTTVERFNIRADQWNQCLNGVQWNRPTTLFPSCIAMAATWNPDLVRDQIGRVLSDEARAIYNGWHLDPNAPGEHKGLIYRDPVINIGRNPYWGRNHEAFGEDPFLTGRMAVAYVRGIQGEDPYHLKLAATLKHYAVNNVETDRMKLDAQVSERMLHEYWLPHFRDAVVEGNAQSLMASYNAINGTPNNINHWLLTDVLKHDWQHSGFVVSDLGGVKTMVEGHEQGNMTYVDAVAQSLMAGCDFSDKEFEQNIPEAVRQGKLSEERLDDALTRVLRTRFLLGEFDPFEAGPYSKIPLDVIGSPAHRAVALDAARQSIVLLQNRDGLLPLDRSTIKRIAVIGPLSDLVVTNNYNGRTGEVVTALQGIKDRAGNAVEVVHVDGCPVIGGDAAVTVDQESGFSQGASVKFDPYQIGQYIEFPVEIRNPGVYAVSLRHKAWAGRGIYQLSIDGEDQVDPVDLSADSADYDRIVDFGIKAFDTAGVKKFRFTVVGKPEGSDSLSGHFDKLILAGDSVASVELENIKPVVGGDTNSIEEAAAAAGSADVALVFVGTDERVEQEGRDRTSLGLPGDQEELVKAVLAANPRTVVIQKSAGPLTVPWLAENAPAMLQAWWSGEEGGHAIADVLFGDTNPAGRLPHTVYASESQVPPIDEYDISKGFTYMYVKGDPLYPFGHGLSYTTFDYSPLRISPATVPANDSATVAVDVTNTGSREGDEVVQLYVAEKNPTVTRPAKELRGFKRVSLKPGETREVSFTLPGEKLAFWDEDSHAFVTNPGAYAVMIGASSADIRSTGELAVTAAPSSRRYGPEGDTLLYWKLRRSSMNPFPSGASSIEMSE